MIGMMRVFDECEYREFGGGRYRINAAGTSVQSRLGRGRVFSLDNEWQEMKLSLHRHGYLFTCISVNGVKRNVGVHRIVCGVWNEPTPGDDYHACHIDGDVSNNHYTNLRWGTRSDNMRDSVRHGTQRRGTKISKDAVTAILCLRGITPYKRIAEMFGCSTQAVSNIMNRIRHADVPMPDVVHIDFDKNLTK